MCGCNSHNKFTCTNSLCDPVQCQGRSKRLFLQFSCSWRVNSLVNSLLFFFFHEGSVGLSRIGLEISKYSNRMRKIPTVHVPLQSATSNQQPALMHSCALTTHRASRCAWYISAAAANRFRLVRRARLITKQLDLSCRAQPFDQSLKIMRSVALLDEMHMSVCSSKALERSSLSPLIGRELRID